MPKKILVADDSQTIQRSVAIALEEFEVELIPVKDPGQFLSKVKETSPDLILLDNRMNRNKQDDGYALCSQLKADPQLAHIPVIFLAGHSYLAEKGDLAGAILAIAKPFETGDFAEKVMDLVQVSEALSGEMAAPVAVPVSGIATASPVPKVTTAMPVFQPVNPATVLPESVVNTAPMVSSLANVPESTPTPPPLSYGLPPSEQEDLRNVGTAPRTFTPPPLPQAPPPLPVVPPPIPSRTGSSSSIPRPQENTLEDSPQTVEYASTPTPIPAVSTGAAESPRRSPRIIPPPSDEAAEFPVKELLQTQPPAAYARAPESELEMDSPEYFHPPSRSSAAAPADFALDPKQDYLARALQGSRSWAKPASAPASPQDAAQMEYLRQLSLDVIERVVWEVVPELAEHIIKEAVARQNSLNH